MLLEAMSCGVSVVAGDLPTIRELIQHKKNGILVNPEDIDDLTNALARLIKNRSLRESFGKAGRKRVVEEFSLGMNVKRIQQAFQSVLREPAQG